MDMDTELAGNKEQHRGFTIPAGWVGIDKLFRVMLQFPTQVQSEDILHTLAYVDNYYTSGRYKSQHDSV